MVRFDTAAATSSLFTNFTPPVYAEQVRSDEPESFDHIKDDLAWLARQVCTLRVLRGSSDDPSKLLFSAPSGEWVIPFHPAARDTRRKQAKEMQTLAKRSRLGKDVARRPEFQERLAKLAYQIAYGKLVMSCPVVTREKAMRITDLCLLKLGLNWNNNGRTSDDLDRTTRQDVFAAIMSATRQQYSPFWSRLK